MGNIEGMNDVECENIRNVEDRIDVIEHIRNVEQFANIRDEVFKVFDEMEVNFEDIMDQGSSDEKVLSDIGSASDMSEYEMDRIEKFVSRNPYVGHSY